MVSGLPAANAAAGGAVVGGRAGRGGGGRGGAWRGVGRVRGWAAGGDVIEVGHAGDRVGRGCAAPGGGAWQRYGGVGARLERRGHRVWAEPDLSRIDK